MLRKKMSKRVLALALSAFLTCSLLPQNTVYAAGAENSGTETEAEVEIIPQEDENKDTKDVVGEELAEDVTKNDDTSDAAKNSDTSDTAKSDDTSDTAKSDDTSDTAKNDDTSDTAKNDDTSDAAKSDDTSDVTKNDDTSDVTKQDGVSDATTQEDKKDVVDENQTADKTGEMIEAVALEAQNEAVVEESLSAYWQDSKNSTLDKMTWRQSYGANVEAQFPTGATDKKVIIKPESAGMQLLNNLSDNEAVKSGATVSTADESTTAEFGDEAFADATTTYTLNNSTDNLTLNGILFGSSAFYNGNTGRPLLVSTPASGAQTIKITMTWTEDGEEKSKETTLTVNSVDTVEPSAVGTGQKLRNYFSEEQPKYVKTGGTYATSYTGEQGLAGIYFKISGDDSSVANYQKVSRKIPVKEITLTLKVSKNLSLELGSNWKQVSSDPWPEDSNYNKVVVKFVSNGSDTNYWLGGYGGTIYVNFAPSVTVSDSAVAEEKLTLSVEEGNVTWYQSWSGSGKNLTGTTATKIFTKGTASAEDNFYTAYYQVHSQSDLWATAFKAGSNNAIGSDGDNAAGRTMTGDEQLYWYHEDYSDAVGLLGYFQIGNYGTDDAVEKTVVMKFDTDYIGVRGIRLPMSAEQLTAAKGGKELTVKYKTNKNSTARTKTITNINGAAYGNWAYVYVDSDDLDLGEGEYVSEIQYTLTTVPADWSAIAKGNYSVQGGNEVYQGWFFGVIHNYEEGQSVKCTVQIFDDEDCTQAATNEGTYTNTIAGEGRVNIGYDGWTGLNGRPGMTVTDSNNQGPSGDTLYVDAGETLHFSTTLRGVNQHANAQTIRSVGYSPVKTIYIRNILGTDDISKLNIQNTYTRDYLVQNGVPAAGVTITTTTEAANDANLNRAVKVYKITIDSSQLANKWDNVIGTFSELGYGKGVSNDSASELQNARISISYDATVSENYNTSDEEAGLPNSSESVWVECDSDTVMSGASGAIQIESENAYQGCDRFYTAHGDTYDLNNDSSTDYVASAIGGTPAQKYYLSQKFTEQGDYTLTHPMWGVSLKLTPPATRTDYTVEGSIKESKKGSSAYRAYDSSDEKGTMVDLSKDNADLRVLTANYSENVEIKDLTIYLPIPKKDENWGEFTSNNGFSFSVNLLSALDTSELDAKYDVTITYGQITPVTENGATAWNNAAKKIDFEAFSSQNASKYNCIKISFAGSLPTTEQDGTAQQAITKYIKAKLAYGDKDLPTEDLKDVWKAAYTCTVTSGGSSSNAWKETSEFGLTASRVLRANAVVTDGKGGKIVDAKNTEATSAKKTALAAPTESAAYAVTIQADDHYNLPTLDQLKVKVDDTTEITLTDAMYKKNSDGKTAVLTIPAENVTGDLEIEAAFSLKEYKVTVTVNDGDETGIDGVKPTTAKNGTDCVTQVEPATGYKLPDTITVKVDGNTLEETDYTYDKTTGKITVPGAKITGDVEIAVTCEKQTFTAENNITDGSADGVDTATYGEEYTSKITPDENYDLPSDLSKVTVTVDGVDLTTEEFTYDMKTGVVTIPGEKVTGNITITAVCIPKEYAVKVIVNNGTETGINGVKTVKAVYNIDYATVAEPSAGYLLPRTITVKVGNKTLTETEYTYIDGRISIQGKEIVGDVEIIVTCQKKDFKAVNIVTNGSADGVAGVEYGVEYQSKITAEPNYDLPSDTSKIKVTVDGVELKSDEFTYDKTTGLVTIPGEKVTGNITITAKCTPKTYTGVSKLANGTADGQEESIGTPVHGTDYTTVFKANNKYKMPKRTQIAVTIGGVEYTGFTYDEATGLVTIPGKDITGDIVITGQCKKKNHRSSSVSDDSVSTSTSAAETSTVSTAQSAKTGDSNNFMLWISFMVIALLGIGGVFITYRRKKQS